MSANRRLDVLRAIVSDYVETQEPIGSKALVERHALGVSAATIRNDMAQLEEEGYIRQPHTSAGRIPTDKGYRYFVDKIDQIKPLSAAERKAITDFFTSAVGIEDVMERTVRLLANLTHQTALVEYPAFNQSRLRHLELVLLGSETGSKVLAILIANTGRIDQILVDCPHVTTEQQLYDISQPLLNIFSQQDAQKRAESLEDWLARISEDNLREDAKVLAQHIETALEQGKAETRIVMAGMANLSRSGDFTSTLTPLVEALEEQVVLLKLFEQMHSASPVSVIIGQESGHEVLHEAAIVSSRYDTSGAGSSHVGVIGPTRMDYPGSMAAVRAVARYLSTILNQ